MAKVFISSTSKDLKDYRIAASDICSRIQFVPLAMEFWEAMGKGATEGSIDKLKQADVYVGIFADRYGYIEDGQSRSVTEIEFDTALALGLEPLCFFLKPDYPLANAMRDDEHRSQLESFHNKVNKLIRVEFTTPEDFEARLYQALSEWQKRHPETAHLEKVLDIFSTHRAFFQDDQKAIEVIDNMQYGDAGKRALIVAKSFADVIPEIQSTLDQLSSKFHLDLKLAIAELIVDFKSYRDDYGGEHIGGQQNWDSSQIQKRYNLSSDDSFKVLTSVIDYIDHSFKDLETIRSQAIKVIECIRLVEPTLENRCVEIKGLILEGNKYLQDCLQAFDRTQSIFKEISLTNPDFKERKRVAREMSQSEDDKIVSSLLKAVSTIPEHVEWIKPG